MEKFKVGDDIILPNGKRAVINFVHLDRGVVITHSPGNMYMESWAVSILESYKEKRLFKGGEVVYIKATIDRDQKESDAYIGCRDANEEGDYFIVHKSAIHRKEDIPD